MGLNPSSPDQSQSAGRLSGPGKDRILSLSLHCRVHSQGKVAPPPQLPGQSARPQNSVPASKWWNEDHGNKSDGGRHNSNYYR